MRRSFKKDTFLTLLTEVSAKVFVAENSQRKKTKFKVNF